MLRSQERLLARSKSSVLTNYNVNKDNNIVIASLNATLTHTPSLLLSFKHRKPPDNYRKLLLSSSFQRQRQCRIPLSLERSPASSSSSSPSAPLLLSPPAPPLLLTNFRYPACPLCFREDPPHSQINHSWLPPSLALLHRKQ